MNLKNLLKVIPNDLQLVKDMFAKFIQHDELEVWLLLGGKTRLVECTVMEKERTSL